MHRFVPVEEAKDMIEHEGAVTAKRTNMPLAGHDAGDPIETAALNGKVHNCELQCCARDHAKLG